MKKLFALSLSVLTLWAVSLFFVAPDDAQADEIKIGAIIAETGGAAFLGIPEARTLRMLTDEVNARGGVAGNTIKLIIKDSGGDPAKAVSFAKQLIEEEKVFAIIGPSTSGETMAIKDICDKNKTLLVSCASTKAIVDPVAKHVFKTPQNDSLAVEMIYLEMQKKGISKIAVAVGGTGFGKMGGKFLNEMAPQFGITVLENEVYDPKSTDLSSLVTKFMANKEVEAVVNWSIVPAQAILAKNMRQAGWDVPLFLSHGFGNIKYVELGGAALEGVFFPAGRLLVADSLPESHPQKAVLVKYTTDYQAMFNNEPVSTFGGHAYDAFKILCKGIETVGKADTAMVIDAIENMTFVGTGGIFTLTPTDHSGLKLEAFEMLTVKDGKFALAN
ncbi:MAG: ABC transporter substrate-binding protein [Desulfobulbaceae bacterium]|uniref:ABC transporter substrate-binding protein n=1 Tax=Candidatus Desulfobia pelagia TaxID=2841692 RepID=A0A8J6NF38_9BACT|nr:ABC transporter substrate-binding protein [Candidatus Desulfobia pelagia]